MKILLISTAYNGLTQRAHLELAARGHDVFFELAISDGQMIDAVALVRPDMVICPFLKSRISAAIWRHVRTVIIHPGIVGDRGPSSLDWAVHNGESRWGVTAFEADDEFDAGDIWASEIFELPLAPKASIYRQEVTEAAIRCILKTIDGVGAGLKATPQHLMNGCMQGRLRPAMTPADRAIDWPHDNRSAVIRKIHAADSFPGALASLCGLEVYLYGAAEEGLLRGHAGDLVGQRDGAVCIATTDGAVWVRELQQRRADGKRGLKLPATRVLGEVCTLPGPAPVTFAKCKLIGGHQEIWYEESAGVGYLHFDFRNGAMSTEQCQRLQHAFRLAASRPTQVIALVGGEDFHGNGIHLSVIEAAPDPVAESWRNINAINDLILEVVTCTSHLTVSAVQGNAGAGGAVFALAGDLVVARSGRVFNLHYKTMGLHGSEYWTYLLPKRIGNDAANRLTESCLPISAEHALQLGLVDMLIDARGAAFMARLAAWLHDLCVPAALAGLLAGKRQALPDAATLHRHRLYELAQMRMDFNGPAYSAARQAFVRKAAATETPCHLARHRQRQATQARADSCTCTPPNATPGSHDNMHINWPPSGLGPTGAVSPDTDRTPVNDSDDATQKLVVGGQQVRNSVGDDGLACINP
jgi:putative two-component system protein, hydrogenase maturation factor HypX/HoxX